MDSSKIKLIFFAILALFAALYLGVSAASAQLEAVLWVVGGVGLAVCLSLGNRIWLLLPLMSSIGLVLPLPGNFSTVFLTQIGVLAFCTMHFLLRKLPLQFRFTELEFWCLLFIACVGQAYMRNPVGLNIFGSDTVGAKPYAVLVMLIFTALLIASLKVAPNDLKWWVRLTMVASWMNFGLGILARYSPSMGMYLGASFATDAMARETSRSFEYVEGNAGRVSYVRAISQNLALWISSRVSPLRACFQPLWSLAVLFTLACAAYSGYRSQLATVGMTYLVGVYYWGGVRQLVITCTLGAMAVTLLAIGNLAHPLPANVQRALTFLPGTWDQRFKDDAQGSTDWRTEIWIEALKSDKYIRNKFFGDGLGMTREQLAESVALSAKKGVGSGGFDYHRESILINGDYHSGPVQTIRVCGYFGLVVLLIGMYRVLVHAHRQIKRCRNTEWFSVAIFIVSIYIWLPLGWVFIFGSFSGGADALLMGAALVRMLEKNLPLP
jgi:hypothetical protein